MNASSPKPAALPATAALRVLSTRPRGAPADAAWVQPVRIAAVFVFLALPLTGFLLPRYAGRIVWTIVIAALPLFIVAAGYARWRRICPLAAVAQLPAKFGFGGRRKASPWLERNYYFVTFGALVVSLWIRLIATNGSGPAIAIFLVALAAIAFAFGALFTGKTWCNYACPVLFVEKLYTEPHGVRETPNSQCSPCTACKHSCPDISQENGYWKELHSRAKRVVTFAFPGVVFGFYFYYFLQAGSWDYYFGGRWTYQPGVLRTAFAPGHSADTAGFFFAPEVPRATAAALTLVACGLVSLALFSLLESRLRWTPPARRGAHPDRARHLALALAAFTAFLTFYSFAGAPTLRKVPGATHLFAIVVVFFATWTFLRRWRRTRDEFAEESLARNIIKRWDWAGEEPPRDLHEAFLLHRIRLQESARGYQVLLDSFREGIRETLADGFVSQSELRLMEQMRDTLHIRQADYEQVLSDMAAAERAALAKSSREWTAEKRLQMSGYAEALRRHLDSVLSAGGLPDYAVLERMREEHLISKDDHTTLLEQCFAEVGENKIARALLNAWEAKI